MSSAAAATAAVSSTRGGSSSTTTASSSGVRAATSSKKQPPSTTTTTTDDSTAPSIILPPPSPLNPLPALPIALRVDNKEQLQSVLLLEPLLPPTSATTANLPRQLLVFETHNLRTLLLRQVLYDPTQPKSSTMKPHKSSKQNWDAYLSFPSLLVQQQSSMKHNTNLNSTIVGTRILIPNTKQQQPQDETSFPGQHHQDDGAAAAADDDDVLDTSDSHPSNYNNSDVITYMLRPSNLLATQLLVHHIQTIHNKRKKKSNIHHRIIYIPQPTALIHKVLLNSGILSFSNVSLLSGSGSGSGSSSANNPTYSLLSSPSLQLDLFPLESDVISLEEGGDDNGFVKELFVDGIPSYGIQCCARSILKLQDVIGRIPRIQAYGQLGEEVVRKLLNMTIDEYISQELLSSNEDESGNHHSNDPYTMSFEYGYNHSSGTSSNSTPVVNKNNVAGMVILDRKVDFVTPMLTPLTYEGLLDEVVGIECGHLHIDVQVLIQDDDDNNDTKDKTNKLLSKNQPSKQSQRDTGMVSLPLNGSDALFAEVRDQHVEKFGTFLQNQAKALKESHANFTQGTNKRDLNEIHQFVKQIPAFAQNLRSLTNHIHLAELIKHTTQEATFREQWQLERSMLEGESCLDQLEELVAGQYPIYKLLRLLCLQSLCQGGIKASRYDTLRRDIVQTYGYQYLFVLHNLEKAGLLSRREGLWVDAAGSGSSFGALRNSLHLIHAEVDTVEPDDIAYVSSGYAPLSVRLIQTAVKGWKSGREDILKETSAGSGIRMVDIVQRYPPEDLATALRRKPSGSLGQNLPPSSNDASTSSRKKPTLIVFYVGGVTHMEIASLRFLSKRPSFPFHIICLTTKVINGTTLLRALG